MLPGRQILSGSGFKIEQPIESGMVKSVFDSTWGLKS